MFRAVRDLLLVLGPSALIVEDVHWADEGTLALLRFLLAKQPGDLAIVLTYRPEELAARGGALGGTYRPAPHIATARIRLGRADGVLS